MQLFKRKIIAAAVDGSALASSTAETSLLPAAGKYTFPENFWDFVGRELHVRASGRISNIVTTPGTLTFKLKFGAVTLFSSGPLNLNTTAQTNATWLLEALLTLRAIGTAANFLGTGRWNSRSLVGSAAVAAGGAGSIALPDTAPAVGSNFDSTAALQLDLTGQWSVNDAGNSILLHQFSAWVDD